MSNNPFDLVRSNLYVNTYMDYIHRYRYVTRPLWCMYFSVNLTQSSIQEGMLQGGTYQSIGPYSSLKYVCIHNYPLSNVNPAYTHNTQNTEHGIYSETELEVIFTHYNNIGMLPSTMDLCVLTLDGIMDSNDMLKRELLPVWSIGNIERLPVFKRQSMFKLKLVNSGHYLKHIQLMWSKQVVSEYWFDELEKRLYTDQSLELLNIIRTRLELTIEKVNEHAMGMNSSYINKLGVCGIPTTT